MQNTAQKRTHEAVIVLTNEETYRIFKLQYKKKPKSSRRTSFLKTSSFATFAFEGMFQPSPPETHEHTRILSCQP